MLNFPDSPTSGQIFQNWTWNGTAWVALGGSGAPFRVQVFTASGTYVPSPGMTSCMIECVGAGGNGGTGTADASHTIQGGGGGAGGYSRKLATAAQVSPSQAVTVGLTASSRATSVGSLCVANGGGDGTGANTGQQPANGAGANTTGAVGDVVAGGNPGGFGLYSNATGTDTLAGDGGAGPWGGAGKSSFGAAGSAGTGYGSGGAGGHSHATTTAQNGGAGANGVVVITEYTGATSIPAGALTSSAEVLLQTQTVTTGQVTVNFVLPSTYRRFKLRWDGVSANATGQNFGLHVSIDGGNTWVTGSASYVFAYAITAHSSTGSAGIANSTGTGSSMVQLTGFDIGNSFGNYGEVAFAATTKPIFVANSTMWNANQTSMGISSGGGAIVSALASPLNAVQFAMSSGALLTGNFSLYGIVS